MNADQVRALVAAKWPAAMQSPLAQAVQSFTAADEADRAVEFARLQARATMASGPKPCGDGCKGCAFCRQDTDTPAERPALLADAMEAAQSCLNARDGWTVETLSHNVESAMGGELDADECDGVAREALKRAAAARKVAKIVSEPTACTDDGRALGLRWMLFLNDYGGKGFWHGGPGRPDHCSVHGTEEEAKARAAELGYRVIGVSWT